MSKKSVIEREKKRVIQTNKFAKLRNYLNGKLRMSNLIEEKIFYSSLLQKMSRNSFKSRSI